MRELQLKTWLIKWNYLAKIFRDSRTTTIHDIEYTAPIYIKAQGETIEMAIKSLTDIFYPLENNRCNITFRREDKLKLADHEIKDGYQAISIFLGSSGYTLLYKQIDSNQKIDIQL